jgi:DNA repair protein RadA/Sms
MSVKTKGPRTIFACQECGNQSAKWLGRCPECGNWNTFVEEQVRVGVSARPGRAATVSSAPGARPIPLAEVQFSPASRLQVGIGELDQVLGGGIVPGSLVLVGGDPGIGKSTLLLQLSEAIARRFGTVLYVSGEESVQQIRLRGGRLGVAGERLLVLAENDLERIMEQIQEVRPLLAVIDSIQTVFLEGVSSAPGSVSQVRECAGRMMLLAKGSHIPVFLVGHVNKEGAIAGPRVLEHIVDTVLYLEGERHHSFRILRSQKNRFGSTDEIGIFEMHDSGMREVTDPARAFLQERSAAETGTVVHVAVEGSRPLLVEVQSLVAESAFGIPRRTADGVDLNRLHLLLAVLERRGRCAFGKHDVYVNVAGGVHLTEPAADLAVALAIASNQRGRPVPRDLVALGEVGLSGEVRRVSHLERRLLEAQRLGFRQALVPARAEVREEVAQGIRLRKVESILAAMELCFN